jgi:3'(2'), 5'-bisphosphate nucleotidase
MPNPQSPAPLSISFAEILPQTVALARDAGEAVMRVYAEVNPAIEYKRDNSPLTQADLASHGIIVAGLERIAPCIPVLSEESEEIPFATRHAWPRYWLIDPLDGTKEFLRRNGEFTINIALMEANHPILGVVYAPAIDKMYFAAQGCGAWTLKGEERIPIQTGPSPNGTRRIVVSRSHASGEEAPPDAENCEFIVMGSSLKFCLVADGSADLYPRRGPTMEWDTAAAHCVVEQAGGTVTDLDGNPLLYNKENLLNPGFLVTGS